MVDAHPRLVGTGRVRRMGTGALRRRSARRSTSRPWGFAAALALSLWLVGSGPALAATFSAPGYSATAAPPSAGPPAIAPLASPPPPQMLGGPGEQTASASGSSAAPSPADIADQQLAELDTSSLASFVNAIGQMLPGTGLGWQNLRDLLHGGGVLRHPQALLQALGGVFVGELRASMGLLGKLMVLIVLAAVLRQIQGAFDSEAVGRIADAAVFLALGALCLAGFGLAANMARSAIADLSSFMVVLLPALVGLLAASGSVTTAGLMHPLMVAAVNAVGLLVRAVVFPLALLAAVLDIVGAFSPNFKLSSLSALMRQIAVGVMGLLFTAFLGVVAVSGAAGSVADGVALRTGKYAIKTFVPVVGGMFADAAELVLTSGWLLRSGLGLLGLVAVAVLVAVPVLKMLALWAIYRVGGALAQPVGGEGVAQVLAGVGNALVLLTLAVSAVGLMCFLSLAVLVGASSATLAMR